MGFNNFISGVVSFAIQGMAMPAMPWEEEQFKCKLCEAQLATASARSHFTKVRVDDQHILHQPSVESRTVLVIRGGRQFTRCTRCRGMP